MPPLQYLPRCKVAAHSLTAVSGSRNQSLQPTAPLAPDYRRSEVPDFCRHAIDCRVLRVCSPDVRTVHQALLAALLAVEHDGAAVLVNFWRRLHGAESGHWCVLAGLAVAPGADVDTSHVLVLDPRADKIAPHWMPCTTLCALMCRFNVVTKMPRGCSALRSLGLACTMSQATGPASREYRRRSPACGEPPSPVVPPALGCQHVLERRDVAAQQLLPAMTSAFVAGSCASLQPALQNVPVRKVAPLAVPRIRAGGRAGGPGLASPQAHRQVPWRPPGFPVWIRPGTSSSPPRPPCAVTFMTVTPGPDRATSSRPASEQPSEPWILAIALLASQVRGSGVRFLPAGPSAAQGTVRKSSVYSNSSPSMKLGALSAGREEDGRPLSNPNSRSLRARERGACQ